MDHVDLPAPGDASEASGLTFAQQLAVLLPDDVLVVGELPETIVRLWTVEATDNRAIVVTGERRRHYLDRHPDVRAYESLLAATLLRPDEIHRNKRDADIAIFYKRLDGRKYLRAAVRMSERPGPRRHSVLSLYTVWAADVAGAASRRVWPVSGPWPDQ